MAGGIGAGEPDGELLRALPVLGSVGRVVRRAVRRRFPLRPLTDPQVAVLRTVESTPGIASGAVADRLQLAPSTVSTLVRELVDAGLVVREADERDRRGAACSSPEPPSRACSCGARCASGCSPRRSSGSRRRTARR